MPAPQPVACEACQRRLPDLAHYEVGKPIIVTRVLNADGHAMYRHRSGGAISLCVAPPKATP